MRPTLAFSANGWKRIRLANTLDGRVAWAEWWLVRCRPSRGIDYTERISLFDAPVGDGRIHMLRKSNIDFYTLIDELNINGIKDHTWVTHAHQIWRRQFGNATWRYNRGQDGDLGPGDDDNDQPEGFLDDGAAYEGGRGFHQESGENEAHQHGEVNECEVDMEEGGSHQSLAEEEARRIVGDGRIRENQDAEVLAIQEELHAHVLRGTPPTALFAPSPRPSHSRLVGRGHGLYGIHPAPLSYRPAGPSNTNPFPPPPQNNGGH